jgi:uncharacterized membrane protein YqjE
MEGRQRALIWDLRRGSTLLLLLFGILTLGVYIAIYIWRQTRAMNRHLPRDERMWLVLPAAIGLLSLATPVLLVALLLSDSNVDLIGADRITSEVAAALVLLWGLRARRKMNDFLDAAPGDETWFGWLGSFVLTPIYFNIKVNHICRSILSEAHAPPEGPARRQSSTPS